MTDQQEAEIIAAYYAQDIPKVNERRLSEGDRRTLERWYPEEARRFFTRRSEDRGGKNDVSN